MIDIMIIIDNTLPMNDSLVKILVPSLIGLIGVVIGTVVTSIINYKLKSKETKLRIVEKVFDKRIQAHENILILIKKIRSVLSIEMTDENCNLITFPSSMTTKENFRHFANDLYLTIHQNSHWLNTNLERELGFLMDYITSLSQVLKDAQDEAYPKVGLIVKQDFIDLASSLENITFDFFRKDIFEMNINKHNEWHKYPKDVTFDRYSKTILSKKLDEIKIIIINVA